MTNKIILESLKLKGLQNPDALVRILTVVPNPTATLEMLLGVYTPTNVEEFGQEWKSKYGSEEFLIWVDEVDDIANTVTYRKYEHKKQEVYYLTKQDRENNVFVTEKPKDYYTSGYVRTTGYAYTTETKSMEDFKSRYIKSYPNVWEHWANDADTYVNPWLAPNNVVSHHEDLF